RIGELVAAVADPPSPHELARVEDPRGDHARPLSGVGVGEDARERPAPRGARGGPGRRVVRRGERPAEPELDAPVEVAERALAEEAAASLRVEVVCVGEAHVAPELERGRSLLARPALDGGAEPRSEPVAAGAGVDVD